MGEGKQDDYLFILKMYKQIMPVSLSLLLKAFPSRSLSLIKIMADHGLCLFSVKVRLSWFAVCEIPAPYETANEDSLAFAANSLRP